MKIVFALVIWFGAGNAQSSFAISGIATQQECQRLGRDVAKDKPLAQVRCYPYRAPA